MLRQVFIQENGNGRMVAEMRSLLEEFQRRGIPTALFTAKRLTRRQLPLARDTLVAGYIDAVVGALKQLKVPVPEPNDYPTSLRSFLRRRVWESTVGAITTGVWNDDINPRFVKPKGRLKRFTGFVVECPDDLRHFGGASSRLPVYCSNVVAWQSEYRVFVVHGRIVGVRHYAGDSAIPVDESVVQEAIRQLHSSGEALAGFGIDFGVLGDGQTALVEMNDGFGLGSYGLDGAAYADLIVAAAGTS